jgi:hypothetical protein
VVDLRDDPGLLDLLKSRDLGHVEDVSQLDRLRPDAE